MLAYDLWKGNIYRPPKKSDDNDVIQQFNTELHPLVDLFGNENKNCIVTSDTNINLFENQ